MKLLRGYSIIELLCVMAIKLVLSSILSPVLVSVRESVNVRSSQQRLRQLHAAVWLYQSDSGTEGPSSDALPAHSYVYSSFFNLGSSFFVSPCGYKPDIEENTRKLSYSYWNIDASDYYQRMGVNGVLFADPHCNDNGQVWQSKYLRKRGLAVLYSGSLVNHFKPGDVSSPEWWSRP